MGRTLGDARSDAASGRASIPRCQASDVPTPCQSHEAYPLSLHTPVELAVAAWGESMCVACLFVASLSV